MASKAQLAANRANSKKSTGPKTQVGKEASSQNRRTHGLTGTFFILGDENPEEYKRLYDNFAKEYQPVGQTETTLVKKLAEAFWLSQRAMYLQSKLLADPKDDFFEKDFALYLRYQIANDRAFSKALNDLLKLRAEKRKAQIGFESQKHQENRQRDRAAAHQASENRKNELHRYKTVTAEMRLK